MINLVIDILKANTTLTNLVSTDNIYPLIQLQGGNIPSVVVQLTNTTPNDTQEKVSTYDDNSVEVTCFAISPAAAWAISEAVRGAIDGYTGGNIAQIRFQSQATDIFESTEVFSVTQGYSVHLKRDGATLPTAIAGLGLFNLDDINNVDNEVVNALDRQALVYDEATSQWIADGVGQVVIPVRNPSRDTPIAVGTVLKATGAQGDRILVAPFEPDTDDMKYLVGIASEVLGATNDTKDGHAQVYGELRAFNTNAYEVGDVLYAAAGGTLSTTENQYPIAIVTRKQQNTGRIFIRMWTPGKGYHQRYRTQASAKMFVGVGATVELYYTATADGDGFVTQDLTAAVGDGNTEERVLRYKSGAFGDTTVLDYTDAGLATDATYAEMLTAFNNLLATEGAPITIYATRTEVSGRSGLLADYPGAAAAYSLRLLDTDYTGSAIRVRRASDNAEQDIGFDGNGDLDTSALATFCAGTDGYVVRWYDQSGNANDAVQATTSAQPQIVASGSVQTDNGKPAAKFNGGQVLITSSYVVQLSANNASVFAVANTPGTNSDYVLNEADSASPFSSNFILGRGNDGRQILWVNSTIFGAKSAGQNLFGFDYNGTNFQAHNNGSTSGSAATATVNTEAFGVTGIGGRVDATQALLTGYIQEIITYKSDQSTNRTNIESNINTYYSIY